MSTEGDSRMSLTFGLYAMPKRCTRDPLMARDRLFSASPTRSTTYRGIRALI